MDIGPGKGRDIVEGCSMRGLWIHTIEGIVAGCLCYLFFSLFDGGGHYPAFK